MARDRFRCLAGCLGLLCLPAMAGELLPVTDQPLHQTWPAQALIEQVVALPADGRYAVVARGEQPVAVQTVDHIMGPSARHPERQDLIAEAGELKVRLHAPADATGEIEMHLHPFTERNDFDDLPVLEETRLLTTELQDFEQRSWWLVVDRPRTVTIELAGRYLADVRLWRNGDWIEDLEPEAREIDPAGGEPLAWRRIHTRLEAGTYRLAAYGGPGTTWAEDSDDVSLYVRKGVPRMPAWGWWEYETSPFGVDYWRVEEGPNLFELRPEEADTARLAVSRWSAGTDPNRTSGNVRNMSRNARDPRLVISDTSPGERLLQVRYRPGGRYRLAALHQGRSYPLSQLGRDPHLISLVGASDPRDTIDATALVIDRYRRSGEFEVVTEQMPVLDTERGWARRFNLLRQTELLFRVARSGEYRIELTEQSEAMVEWKLRPLYSDTRHGLAGEWQFSSRKDLTLNEGLYALQLRPARNHPGIAELRLRHTATRPETVPVESGERDRGVLESVTSRNRRILRLNDFDQGHGGAILRPLPLRLDTPLPVTQAAESQRSFEVRGRAGQVVRASRADGSRLDIGLSADGPWQDELSLGQVGTHTVWVRNQGEKAEIYNLHASLPDFGPESIDELSGLTLEQEPERRPLPTLRTGQPVILDMRRGSERSHLVQVTRPALYRLETIGLLDTEVSLRNRVRVDLGSSSAGGSGRNFLLQRHLGPGEYRMVNAVRGRSAGELGLQVAATPLLDAGELDLEATGRTTIEPGKAAVYEIDIEQAGRYRIQARGLKSDFSVQIEGPDGWPVVRPGSSTPLTAELQPGRHRIVVLPGAVAARVLTSVRPEHPAPTPVFQGHGPHRLEANQRLTHHWRESEPRQPDLWDFNLPDRMRVRLTLDEAMEARLKYREDDDWQPVSDFAAGRFQTLPAGNYRLAVQAARVDDRRDYSLRLRTRELVPGQRRQARLPSDHWLSLDEAALVRLWTGGRLDLQARLEDEDGQRIDFSDHRPDDWNMLISRQLPAGRYRLRLSAVNSGSGSVDLHYDRIALPEGRPLAMGEQREIAGGQAESMAVNVPDTIPEHGLLLAFASRSHATHGVSLEQRGETGWEVLSNRTGRTTLGGFVLDPEAAGAELRLRAWPLDDVPAPIRLGLADADTRSPVAGELMSLKAPLSGLELLAVGRDHHGLSRLHPSDLTGWHWLEGGRELTGVDHGWIPASRPVIWLMGEQGHQPHKLQAVRLAAESTLRLPVGDSREIMVDADENSLRVWQLDSAVATVQLQALANGRGSGWAFGLQLPGQAGSNAMALALPGTAVERLHLARADQRRAQQPARLREQRLEIQSHGALDSGSRLIRLPAGSAAHLERPAGRPLRVALPAGGAAALSSDDNSTLQQLMSAGTEPASVRLDADGDTLWLINASDQDQSFKVRVELGADELNTPWQWAGQSGYSGWQEWRLSSDRPLRLAGDSRAYWQIDEDGQRSRPQDDVIDPARGRRVLLRHGPEHWALWQPDRLDGETLAIDSDGRKAQRIRPHQDGLLQLRLDDQLIERWLPGGHSHWTILPAGQWQLRFAAAPGQQADGLPEVTAEPAETLSEGLSPSVRLGPGESRWFQFELAEEQTIGIGLQSEREAVELVLHDAAGEPLGTGVAQMHQDLAPGRYLVRARLTADQSPLWLRLALVGTDTPDDLIPASVRQRLMDASQ
ncbi:hypothetical protein IC757_01155 [Wenzhouxiangella sp. AB-CW3]|uniref:hypothetical protein n=1 Tax=Wenzhouxiangella sp. AB-CW3 TaxID=2771012 RepID=UPI00168BF60E|nr:hypothetical protein [Wenzhouxiangella sp. AB-CW3]QOC22803.1 hypothetical protein IC757_01155 [Wenzhouxiangella sp. AB-CW3]